jgi:hypothetical protein
MSNDTKGYNGWSNYETWCVHLWLTNEEGSYRYWREEAGRHWREGRENATETLAEQLKSELEEASPIQEASLFSDLLNAALGEVDWFEVAVAFLEDVEPDDGGPDGDDVTQESDQGEEDESDEEAYSAEEFEKVKRERVESTAGPLFELGQVASTPGALSALTREDIARALARHHRGDWGDVGRHDWRENEASLKEGFRLLSAYRSEKGEKFWVITEADRSATTVLLPSEY